MNRNYLRGRRFEYERMRYYRELGAEVCRTAGSHGKFDLIVFGQNGQVTAVQCKVVQTEAEADRLLKAWETSPPLPVRRNTRYLQRLDVKIASEVKSRTV